MEALDVLPNFSLFLSVLQKMTSEKRRKSEAFAAEVAFMSPALLCLCLLLWAQMDEEMTIQRCFVGERHFARRAAEVLQTFERFDVVNKVSTLGEHFLAVGTRHMENFFLL